MGRVAFTVKELLVAIAIIAGLAFVFVPAAKRIRQAPQRENHVGSLNQITWSKDGKRLASVTRHRRIKIWDAVSGAEISTLAGHPDGASGVTFSADGKRLASAGWDKTVRIWDVATGDELLTLIGHGSRVTAVTFSPDGK